jgi:hypothetical protein
VGTLTGPGYGLDHRRRPERDRSPGRGPMQQPRPPRSPQGGNNGNRGNDNGKGNGGGRRRRPTWGRASIAIGLVVLVAAGAATVGLSDLVVRDDQAEEVSSRRRTRAFWRNFEVQSLDGRNNNRRNPAWGTAGSNYARVAPANYADGLSEPPGGPSTRYVSNRIFNDTGRNVFSERQLSQWTFVWGQFIDHTIGLRDDAGEPQNLPFDAGDPLESFTNTLGHIPFSRSAAAPGTGVTSPREQVNTLSSYIDAEAVYGTTEERLEWLREGPVDGDLSNNGAKLLLDEDGLLPRSDSRGDAATAPAMARDGRLMGDRAAARVAGDQRANENIALTATHTVFAREHNRIVDELPPSLSEEQKFEIARRVVIAEQQYITYREFLPALGVHLPRYRGYQRRVDASLGNEFATVGYRAHSLIHGDVELTGSADRYTAEQLAAITAAGIEVEPSEDGSEVHFTIPLNIAYFNPDLVGEMQLGPLLHGVGVETQYNNDEMIDNQLRSVMFQIPSQANPACLDGEELPQCFEGVIDLGALDIERGRDHGMPTYNDLREAYGLEPLESFTEITGEDTDQFPSDPLLTPGVEIDDPDSITFMTVTDATGLTEPADLEDRVGGAAVDVTKRTPLAARLRAIYGSVDDVDAFTGMVAEEHVEGSDMGELQLAMWTQQFQALRDGDRFFYGNDPGLRRIRQLYGIDFRVGLGDVIARNTDVPRDAMARNVFLVPEDPA